MEYIMSHKTTLVFVRHGPVKNPKRLIYGKIYDFPLDPEGIPIVEKTAHLLAEKLNLDCIFTSPTVRTKQTAEIIQKTFSGIPIFVDNRLYDVDISRLEGQPMERLDGEIPEYIQESWRKVFNRTTGFMEELIRNNEGRNIAVVTHVDIASFINGWLNAREGAGMDEILALKRKYNLNPGEAVIAIVNSRTFRIESQLKIASATEGRHWWSRGAIR